MSVQPAASGADRFPDSSRAATFGTPGHSIDEAIWSLPIEIAFGRNREDQHFKNQPGTFGQLAGSLKFQFGDKDGLCILQGALVGGGGQRMARNVVKNYVMTFDHDTGESIGEIEAKIRAAGLFAILWTTYNHGQTETLIAEDALIKFVRAKGGNTDAIGVAHAIEYLTETKKVIASIFGPDSKLSKTMLEGGVKFVVTHAPMSRVRSMFPLMSPFDFVSRGASQAQNMLEWSELYAGHATGLGLSWDRSCIDPSRLMYLPRVRPGTDLVAGGHEISVVAGAMLDVDTIPRVGKEKPGRKKTMFDNIKETLTGNGPPPREESSGEDDGPTPYATDGLLAFLRANARDLEAADLCEHTDPDSVRSKRDGKMEFRCPAEDQHSEQKADDRGFMVANASERPDTGFVMACQHSTCIEKSQRRKGWYLDLFCQEHGLTVIDLLEFCPNAVREEEAKTEAKDALTEAIDKLTPDSTPGDIDVVLRALAKLPQDGILFGYVKKVVKKTGWRRVDVDKAISHHRDNDKSAGGGGDNTPRPSFLPPDDPATANVIWEQWSHADKKNCARARFSAENRKNPVVFQRKCDNSTVRIIDGAGRVTLDPMDRDKWSSELDQHMIFKKITPQNVEKAVSAFPSCLTELNSGRNRDFPVLDRIIEVPVFAPDGGLRDCKGYDAGLQHYINPNIEIRPVPAEVTEEDLSEAKYWIYEALLDFPFSDSFDGNDMEPLYVDEADADGWHMPNYERGAASRTNFIALMLQPIVRGVIDGPTPAYHIDKSAPGTGAGYLMNVAHIVVDGNAAVAQPMSENDEELRKSITSSLIDGAHFIFLDNINHKVASGHLAAALTAGVWKDRILGESRMVTIPNSATWVMAGNNLQFSHELMRRNVPIRIDAAVPNPTQDRPKSFFKHDLTVFMKRERANVLWALHVLALNWIQQGKPAGEKRVPSFDAWSYVLGGIFDAAGIVGFLDNIPDYLANRDDDRTGLDEMMMHLFREIGFDHAVQAKEIFTICCSGGNSESGPTQMSSGQFAFDIPINGKDDHGKQISLGTFLKKNAEGRTFLLDEENNIAGKLVKQPGHPPRYKFVRVAALGG